MNTKETLWIITNKKYEDIKRIRLLESIKPSDEEQKDELVLVTSQVWKDEANWIWMKEYTGKLSLVHIKQMVEETIYGDQYSKASFGSFTWGLEELKLQESIDKDTEEQIWKIEDLHTRLMYRNKWNHLAYDEQLHVYREHAIQYKSISWIQKEYELSSSTVRSIIKISNSK